MRAVLDKKVQGMRSQVMSFANDGVEVSLSIPDTNDVKEAFGSMIDTVAEQHDEIGKLNTNLDTSNQENKQSRRKLVDATNQKLQTLMQHNLELQKQLHYAQRKMRNFSYNVQGFLDPEDQEESSFSTIVDANSLKSVTITLQEVETQDTPPSLFPTEEGANPNRDLVVQRIDSADTSRKIKKKINKYIKIGEKIVEYQNIPDWTCPKDVLARWFWAYRKILQRVRRKDMKIGFSATRIQQHQTISGKLDLIDDELFHLSSSTSTKFDRLKKDTFEQINQQSEKFNQKIDDVYHQQEQLKENHNRRLDDLTVALSSFQNETNEAIQLLKAQQSTNLQTLMEDVERLKARLNFQEDFYLRMKNEELERYQQQTSTLVEESLSLGQSLSLILQCKRNDPIDAFPAESLYSEVQLTSEYLSDYHRLLDTLKQVFQKDQEVKLIRDSAIALQAKSMYLDRSLVNMEAELTALQQRSKTHPQESMNHSSFASVAIAVIPTFRDRLKEFQGNLNWTTRGISHHESVLFSLLDRLLNHSEKAFDDFQRQQGQYHVLKDRFDHLTRSFETLETKNTNLITTIYKVENDIVDLNRQCYVLNNYNKRKISVDLLADDIEGLKAQLVGLKGDISHAQYHYDDSVCDNQSQISNPDPFHFEDDHPVETVEAESEVKEEMINSPPLEEPNLERNSVETSEDCTDLDQLLENEITDSIEEKKDGKPSSSHRKNSSVPREKDNKDAKSRPSTGNGENDEILATTSQRKGEHQRSAKGRRKSTQEKQKSTPPKEQLESLISKICSEQLQNAMREYMSHSPAVITQIGFNHQPNQTTNTQPSSQNRIKDSIAKAIQQAEVYENDEQPVTTTISTEDSLLSKKKRKPNSALMGSFIDYDTRKSFPSSTGAEPPTTTISVRLKSPSSENGHITTNSYNNILGIPTTTSFDPSPIIGDISTLKEEIGGLRHFVTSVSDDKITREEVKDLFFDLFRDQRKRDIKQENNRTQYLDELQKSLQDLNREFTNMKSNQDSFAHQLKVDVDGIMNKLLVKISHEVSESQKDSVFSTKGLCLGCGRVSNVRTQPSSRATSPPFLPALNNHITPGPEIYRGGFRMLGHSNSPQLNQASQLTAQSFPLDGESSLLQQSHVGKEVPLLLRNKVMTLPEAQQREQHPYKDFRKDFESFNPTVVSLATPSMLNSNVDGSSILTEDLNQRKIPENEKETSNAELHLTMPALQYSDQINFDFDADSIKSPHKEKDLQFGDSASIPDGAFEGLQSSSTLNAPASFVPPVIVRSMPSHDSSSLRPIFRKGFPAKKSLKAETTFAPERFDLAASVRAGSASIAVRSNQSSTGKVTGNPLLSKSVSNGK